MAVACGTPIPRTPRDVQACPGPTPTRTPTAPVHDHRDVELPDEALEVERRDRLRHMLGGDDRSLDHEQVELGGK
jgi:hypothetical protein